MTIDERFDRSLERVRERGYIPHRFLQMPAEIGIVRTVRALLQPWPHNLAREGFTKTAWELKMPEETIEAIALEYADRGYFTEPELAEARKRLDGIGYKYALPSK
jgi:hypothetical protein